MFFKKVLGNIFRFSASNRNIRKENSKTKDRLEKFTYIDNQNNFNDFLKKLENYKTIVLDTEFTHRTTYFPILSIIQIAVIDENNDKNLFIIDCKSNLNLEGFYRVINDEKIMKILHSPKQDLQIFFQESQLKPKNIIDTQLMANFCDIGFNIGYSVLVEKFLKIKLDKFEQNSNWQKRPLTNSQIKYALLDVEYLHQIFKSLKQELEKLGRYSWFLEEMEIFLNKIFDQSNENLFKPYFFKNKSPSEIFVIKKLILFREEMAKKINVPRQHFIKDEAIEQIVIEQKISPRFDKETREKILEILDLGLTVNNKEELELKKTSQINKEKKVFLEVKNFINFTANKLGLKSQILLTTADIKLIISDKQKLKEKVCGWRFELFGKELEKIINL